MASPARRKKRVNWRALNALVYCLVVLAVFLGVIAAWRRYSQRRRPVEPSSELGDAVERRIEAFKPSLGFTNGWMKAGGLPRDTPAASMCRFFCAQCRSSCWMLPGRRCPACPFCGRVMTQQETGPSLASPGGWSQAGGLPRDTPAAPMCRFFCAQCQSYCWMRPAGGPPVCPFCGRSMARQGPRISPIGGAAAWCAPKALWRGVAAPATTPNAVRPTLVRELGMEVCPAPGAGVTVTGVMGSSRASNAGLRAGDIIIEFNGSKVRGVERFQQSVSRAAPETDAQVTVLRSGRTRDLLIMVGEGEMEGVGPIQRP